MPILENKLVDELVKATLAVFESIFASKICDYQNKKITLKYFDDFDESILSCIRNTIKDQYELEKAQEFILQHPLYFKQNYQFIDDDKKINFIDDFYKKIPTYAVLVQKELTNALRHILINSMNFLITY